LKRIIFSLMIIMAIFSIAGTGSLAYFEDSEVSSDNSLQLGVWDLESDSGTLSLADLWAGSSGTRTWTVTNTGTVPAYLDLVNIDYTQYIGETNQDELDDEPTSLDTEQLENYLMVHLFVDYSGDGWTDVFDENIYGTAATPLVISGIASSYNLNLLLDPNISSYITINWNIPDTTDDRIYGDELALSIEFDLQPTP